MKKDITEADKPKAAKYDVGQVLRDLLLILGPLFLLLAFVFFVLAPQPSDAPEWQNGGTRTITEPTTTYGENGNATESYIISEDIVWKDKYEFGRVEDYLVVQPEYGDEILFQSDEIKSVACGDPIEVTCFDIERETLILCDPQINGGECSEVASAKPEREKVGLSYEPAVDSVPSHRVVRELTPEGIITETVTDL